MCSFLSIVFPEPSIWFDTARQWYEAWVIYNFTCLLLAYVGGPGQVEVKLDGKEIRRSCLLCTCCFTPSMLVVNGRYVRWCKIMTLQFVYFITPMSIVTVILFEKGLYDEGDWSPGSSYLWIQILYNISYTLALSALFFFYYGTHELLEPFKPVLKFVVIKGVVFLTFWQGIVVSMLYGMGLIPTAEAANQLQNFLTLVEMVLACVMMLYAFPWKEYVMMAGGQQQRARLHIHNIRDAVSIHDVVHDTYHSFAPAYHDYVLYSDGTKTPRAPGKGKGRQVRKSFRARTFLMMGQESSQQQAGQELVKDMEMGVWGEGDGTPPMQERGGGQGGPAPPSGSRRPAGGDLDPMGPIDEGANPDAFWMEDDDEEDIELDFSGSRPTNGSSGGGSSDGGDHDGGPSSTQGGAGGSGSSREKEPGGLAPIQPAKSKEWVHIDLSSGKGSAQEDTHREENL